MSSGQVEQRRDQAIAHYFGLEALEVLEDLLALCGPTIDARALPLLAARLATEEAALALLTTRGYTRMAEKSAHLATSLRALIQVLKEEDDDSEPR